MAAFATQASNKVWERVRAALAGASPAAQREFKELKQWLATQVGNPDLQFLPFGAADAAAAGGTVLATGVKKVYGFYVKKTAVATRNVVKIYDSAADDTTAGQQIFTADLIAASQEQVQICPQGYALANGAVITAHTTNVGTTDGSTANAGSGFIIVG